MFMNLLNNQTTEEQKAKWLPLAQNYKLIGTYAQTELGHGKYLNISFCIACVKIKRFLNPSYNFEGK